MTTQYPRKSIAHFRSSEFFGGPEQGIANQTISNDKFDWYVFLFSSQNSNTDTAQCFQGLGAVVEQFSPNLVRLPITLSEIYRRIQAANILLLITHDYKTDFYGYLLNRRFGVHWIPHFHGFTSDSFRVRFYNFMHIRILRCASRVLAVSNASKNLLVKLGVDESKIQVVHNVVAEDRILSDRAVSKHKFQNFATFRFIAAGRMSEEKGFDLLIKAFDRCKTKLDNVILDIYGDGPLLETLKKAARKLPGAHSIVFYGYIDDILPAMRKAHCLVVSSHSEGMPNVILEAWAQGTAVISTSVGGIPEMVNDGDNGLLIQPNSIGSLAAAMCRLAMSPDFSADLARNGFETVRQRFSSRSQISQLNQIYGDAIDCE